MGREDNETDLLDESSRSCQDQDELRPTSRLSMSMDLDVSFRDKIRSKFKTALVTYQFFTNLNV